VDEHGQFDVVVANNVLAHVSDLEDFVRGLNIVTHRDSVIVVEVQYLGDLVAGTCSTTSTTSTAPSSRSGP
jgi:hypothetical protein